MEYGTESRPAVSKLGLGIFSGRVQYAPSTFAYNHLLIDARISPAHFCFCSNRPFTVPRRGAAENAAESAQRNEAKLKTLHHSCWHKSR